MGGRPSHLIFGEHLSLLKKSVSDRSRAQNRVKTLGNQGSNPTKAGSWIIERNAQRGMEEFFNTLTSSTHKGE
jgi:hypothetical protein